MSRRDLDVLIVGPYPPPLGGVSAHVSRLSAMLAEQGVRVGVLNHFGHQDGPSVIGALHRNPVRYWLALRRPSAPVVHYHHGRLSTLLAVAAARRRDATYVATIHGHTLTRQLEDPFLSRLARWALRRFDELVAVSVEIARGLDTVDHPRVTMLPAYLPSPGRFAEAPTGALPKSGPTLVASAYRIAPAREGDGDVYGLDRAVEVFLGVARSQPRLSLAIFVAKPIRGRWPRRYVKSLVDRARAAGAGERVAVHVGEDLGPAWTRDGVVYLRPTRSDGDAVSVREALAAGRAVIASDAVIRPEGAKTVPGDDVEAWCKAVEQALTGDEAAAGPRAGCSHAETMLDFYARHLAGSGIDAR